eukprot:TRINITY_DN5755_c1_g1_i1.p1 TRINITY_DN5755_c1_g1~~TRINITY_DN5755_c1_g1_i1.p1  ORF type:complete len:425 (-),score=49.22 TRINITY_DN5755_c1_g1_i1:32-1306(-)
MATRSAGPLGRRWEYYLLDAVAKDSSHLVRLAVDLYGAEINWAARIAETYGTRDENAIHYLVSSFGLEWKLGDTLFETAVLNDKHRAASAIASMQSLVPASPEITADTDTVQIALVQCPSEIGQVAKNLRRLTKHIRRAAEQGAKIVVLPETSVTGYLSQDLQTNWGLEGRPQSYPQSLDPAPYAETKYGDSVKAMAALATQLGIFITVPYIEKDGPFFFNSISLVGPSSTSESPVLAHYRKNCPWPHPEKSWATPGEGIEDSIYDTPYGRVGLAICFDIHSILAKYASRDLWALLYPIAWVGRTDAWFACELPDRLGKVNCPHYILGANWATFAPASWQGAGGSSVYAPGGRLLAHATESRFRGCEDLVLVEIPTQKAMPRLGPLDIEKYSDWTSEQVGTDYWRLLAMQQQSVGLVTSRTDSN